MISFDPKKLKSLPSSIPADATFQYVSPLPRRKQQATRFSLLVPRSCSVPSLHPSAFTFFSHPFPYFRSTNSFQWTYTSQLLPFTTPIDCIAGWATVVFLGLTQIISIHVRCRRTQIVTTISPEVLIWNGYRRRNGSIVACLEPTV